MANALGEGGNGIFGSSGIINKQRIDVNKLREFYREELFYFLERCSGNKILILDKELMGSIDLLCNISNLEARDVQTKVYLLSGENLPRDNESKHVIFIVRPHLELMDDVVRLVSQESKQRNKVSNRQFNILFMPHDSEACRKKLKEKSVYASFTHIGALEAHLLPLDSDLLSMECSSSFKECTIDKDYSSLHSAASAIMTLQHLYGFIMNVYCKGELSKRVMNMIFRMRREQSAYEKPSPPQIDNLILIDRSADLLTPFLSQLTYEGFIDEIFHIKNTVIKVPAERFASSDESSPEPAGPKKIRLNSDDELYAELRDKNFNAVGPILSARAKAVSALFDERNAAKSISELKTFVSKLPQLQSQRQSVATQTAIAQMVKEHIAQESFKDCLIYEQEMRLALDNDKLSKVNVCIEDFICKKEPIEKVLRLIAIQSFCNSGLKPTVLEHYKTAIIQVYGFSSIVLLNTMEKAGLIKIQGQQAKTYSSLKSGLNLLVEDVNEQNPTDIAYVYSGYAPISVRIIQHAIRPGWKSIQKSLQLLPGDQIEEVQQIPDRFKKRRASITSVNSSNGLTSESKVTLVFFLGGVTYAEIAALRFLQQEDQTTDYIIATTHIINGDRFISSLDLTK